MTRQTITNYYDHYYPPDGVRKYCDGRLYFLVDGVAQFELQLYVKAHVDLMCTVPVDVDVFDALLMAFHFLHHNTRETYSSTILFVNLTQQIRHIALNTFNTFKKPVALENIQPLHMGSMTHPRT